MAIVITGDARIGIVTTEGVSEAVAIVATDILDLDIDNLAGTITDVSPFVLSADLAIFPINLEPVTSTTFVIGSNTWNELATIIEPAVLEDYFGVHTNWLNHHPDNYYSSLGSDLNLYGNLANDLTNRTEEGLNYYSTTSLAFWDLGLELAAISEPDGTLLDLDKTEIYATDGSLNDIEIIQAVASSIYTSDATINSIKVEYTTIGTVSGADGGVAYVGDSAVKQHIVSYTYSYPSSGTNLVGDLAGFNLSEADLSGIDFKGADLSRARLTGSDLTDADLSGANLENIASGMIIGQPILPEGHGIINGYIVGPNINLTGADLRGGDFTDIDLNGANLTDTNFIGATSIDANNFSEGRYFTNGAAPNGLFTEKISGNEGDEFLIGSASSDQVYSGGGNDYISTLDGHDSIIVDGHGDVTIDAGAGSDSVSINGHGDILVSMGSGQASITVGKQATGHLSINTDSINGESNFLHLDDFILKDGYGNDIQYWDMMPDYDGSNEHRGFGYVKSADGTNGTLLLENSSGFRGGGITVEVENQLEFDTSLGKWVVSDEGFQKIYDNRLQAFLNLGSNFEQGDALVSNGEEHFFREIMYGG
ncbi:pentapeptide repeat-containing protein, partial [Paracoccaceae bacterium]|nr:pentapeptide repeat-containing protein [Paracoccaceae bacterium]